MLADRWTPEHFHDALLPAERWAPFPPAADRAAWEALRARGINGERAAWLEREAQRLMGESWPALNASHYIACERDGDRSSYERPYFDRRRRLAVLTLAACFGPAAPYLDDIVDGLWAICAEPTWVVPPHCWPRLREHRGEPGPNDVLPPHDEQVVDLFAAETAATLALCVCLLRDELTAISPFLVERVEATVEQRNWIILETREADHWWAGTHNWSTWCAASSLTSAMMLMRDRRRLATLAHRLSGVIDRFIGHYTDDGACDEGPMYWSKACGQLLVFLDYLHQRSEGAIAIWDLPKLQAMSQYIHSAHMCGPWFNNVADAGPLVRFDYPSLYRGGERLGRPDLCAMARYAQQGFGDPEGATLLHPRQCAGWLACWLHELFWMPADGERVTTVAHEPTTWLPDRQVAIFREHQRPEGLVVAIKGGCNGEAHNHNDVGQLTVCLDGRPVLVDMGSGVYTRDTFKRAVRYTLPNIRSLGHNVPCVDGCEQEAGGEFAARSVHCDERSFSADLAAAYPASAGIAGLERRLVITDPAGFTLTDALTMADGGEHDWYLPLHVWPEPTVVAPGRIRLAGGGERQLELRFDPQQLSASWAPLELADRRVLDCWDDRLFRIDLRAKVVGSGSFALEALVVSS